MSLLKTRWVVASVALVLTAGVGCSSSQTGGDSLDGPPADAATDAVPATDGNAEAAAAPAATPPAAVAEAAPAPQVAAADASGAGTPVAAAPAPEVAASGGTETYKVQKGDTLMRIAFQQYGDLFLWKKIYESNREKIKNPNVLPTGLTLALSKPGSAVDLGQNGDKYKIKTGDTLATISKEIYGTGKRWKKLWEQNRKLIQNPHKIFAGFFLYYSLTPEEKQKAEELKAASGGSLAASAAAPAPAPAAGRTPASAATPQTPAAAAPAAPAAK